MIDSEKFETRQFLYSYCTHIKTAVMPLFIVTSHLPNGATSCYDTRRIIIYEHFISYRRSISLCFSLRAALLPVEDFKGAGLAKIVLEKITRFSQMPQAYDSLLRFNKSAVMIPQLYRYYI